MRMSLLEMTQNILSAMNSDEVNSISDTPESLQVALEVKNTYEELYGNRELGSFQGLINFESGSPTTPNRLTLPDNVVQVKWIRYLNNRDNNQFTPVEYICPEEFIQRVMDRVPGGFEPTITVPLISTTPTLYTIVTNKSPSYYTVFENTQELVFDSFDATYESFLTGSSAVGWALLSKDFQLADSFIPDLDINLFPHFLAEAKSACFTNVKEMPNQKEEQRARRQLVRSQRFITNTKDATSNWYDLADYSRKR